VGDNEVTDGRQIIGRYYSELWNQWSAAALEELISPDIIFRGSIGTVVRGIDEFRAYVNRIRSAFPDFHNRIEELVAEGASVVARLTYTGTHQGEIFGFRGSGAKVSYQGMAIFHLENGKVMEGHVLGDVEALKRQLLQGEIAAAAERCAGKLRVALATRHEEEWAAALMSSSEPWMTLRRDFEQSLEAMRNPNHSLVVAHGEGGGPAGFMLVHLEGLAGCPYIKSIAVPEASRGAGVGTEMLRFAEASRTALRIHFPEL